MKNLICKIFLAVILGTLMGLIDIKFHIDTTISLIFFLFGYISSMIIEVIDSN